VPFVVNASRDDIEAAEQRTEKTAKGSPKRDGVMIPEAQEPATIPTRCSSSALWSDNWVCSKFPAGEPAEALVAALREREFTNLGADPIVGPQRSER
jgi:hypothetical protein